MFRASRSPHLDRDATQRPQGRRILRSLAALGLAVTASCASVEFRRETASSGTFEATGLSFTLFSHDFPKSALDIARGNVSDARQQNVVVTEAKVWPDLWIFDWVFEIVGFRRARVAGTWGFPPDEATAGSSR